MNQTFNLKRFGMLFIKHTVENIRNYAMSLFVFFAILSVTILISNYHSYQPHQIEPFMIFLIAAGTVFTSNIFINLGDKRKTIATLTLPASTLEKFLVGWVYSFVIFIVLYTAIYYGMMLAVLHLREWPKGTELIDIFSKETPVYYIFFVYTILHAIVIYGAIAFKKMHFIKTAFALFLIGGAIWLVNDKVLGWMVNKPIAGNPPFFGASFRDSDHSYYNVDLSYNYLGWILALTVLLSVIIWVAAYFRLKEKQV
ncbi:MAG: hypothetical protein ABIN91_15915 [Mucilaginibacter sp.]|uniref:hypothetical protein n=1 Tax=Mucilaginibacter sp. TaxID=1882438 RepID=UPI00326767A4